MTDTHADRAVLRALTAPSPYSAAPLSGLPPVSLFAPARDERPRSPGDARRRAKRKAAKAARRRNRRNR